MKNLHLKLLCFSVLLTLISCSETKTTLELKADAQLSIQAGDTSKAIIMIKNIIKTQPDDAEARFLLGKAYMEQEQFLNAEKELNKSVELGFFSPELTLLLARNSLAKSEFNETIKILASTSFDSKENRILAHFMRTKAYLSINNLSQAKEQINKSIEIDKNSSHSLLGSALIAEHQSESEKALSLIAKVIKQSPILPEALLLKGSIESRMREFKLAAETYSNYLKLKPNSFMIKSLTAHNLIRADEHQQAQLIIDELLLITEEHPTINLLAAQLALVGQNYELSKELANKVLISTNNGLAQIISGLSNYYLQNNEQAYYQLNAIADDLPRNHKIHQVLAVLQLKLGYTDELSETLQKIDNQDVENAELFTSIGKNLAQKGDFQGANKLFERAVKISPKSAKIKTQQGIIKLLNTDQTGIEDLQEAIILDPELKEANLALAMNYLKNNELKKATEISEQWLAKQPKNIYALLLRGNIAIKASDLNSAKRYFNQAVVVDPTNLSPLFNIAVIEAEQKKHKISNEFLDKILEIDKEYKPAYRLLISNAMQLEKEDELQSKLSQLVKSSPDSVWPRIILSRKLNIENKYQDANTILEELTDYKNLPVDYFLTLSNNYFSQNKFSEVESLYAAWQKAQPNNSKSFTMHISFLNRTEKYKKALKITQLALSNPILSKDFQLLSFESYFLLLTKNVEQASIKIRYLAQIKPDDAFVLRIQGQIALAKQDHTLAAQYLKKSFELKSDIYTGLYLATAYKKLNDSASAIEFLESELIKSPENHTFRKFLAEIYISESPKKAIQHYKTIVSINTKDIVALNNLAWLLFKSNDLEQALKFSLQAKAIAPNHPQILDTLGIIYIEKKNINKAIEALSSANIISPKNAEIIIHLAQAYKADNNQLRVDSLVAQLTDEDRKTWADELGEL